MIGRTHDLAAISLLSVFVVTIPIPTITLGTALLAILANQIGGIAPDIDQPTAPFWRNLPIGGPIGKIVNKTLGGHRFLTHSLIGLGLLGFLAYYLLNLLAPIMPHITILVVWEAFVVGAVSHLIMDSFTKEGVPWLLPIPIKFGIPPMASLRITTGKTIEKFIVAPGLIAFDIWLYTSHYHYLTVLIHTHLIH